MTCGSAMNRLVSESANRKKTPPINDIATKARPAVILVKRSARSGLPCPSDLATIVITATEKPKPGKNETDSI